MELSSIRRQLIEIRLELLARALRVDGDESRDSRPEQGKANHKHGGRLVVRKQISPSACRERRTTPRSKTLEISDFVYLLIKGERT